MAKVDISKFLARAEEATHRRNYDLAILNYIHALSLVPGDLDTRGKLRAVQNRRKNEKGAQNLAAQWFILKAKILAALGKTDQALAACEMALSRNCDAVPAMFALADIAAKKGHAELAAWQRREVAENFQSENVDNLYKLVDLYEELNQPDQAIKTLEAIQKIDPGADIGPRLTSLQAQQTSEIFSQGVATGSRSIVKDADEADKLELESGKLRTDEQREKALDYLKTQDLARTPDDYRIWLRLADIAADLENPERAYTEAKQYLAKAAELNPIDNTVKDRQGDIEIRKLRNDARSLKAAVDAAPDDPAAREAFRAKRNELVRFEVGEFERRIRAQPLKADFHHRLGELYFQTRRYEEAIGELQGAAKDPKYRIAALTMMGRCFVENKQLDLAIDQFRQAREGQELFTKTRDPLYYEATALEAKGDPESLKQALAIYTQLYQVDISFRDVRRKMPELQEKVKSLAN